ncbi:MAG TPA: MAPEG family protein [Bacteriovoracaceae bacterium]|nr:MAPEG family protein [Bacteriovoracaceae bacterium]
MKEEWYWLSLILLQTALMFVPYVLNLFYKRGILGALRYYQPAPAMSDWAQRARAAHLNAIENLVVLAPAVLSYLILMKDAADAPRIVVCLQIYFFSRLAHYVVYAMKLNYLRTIFFLIGWITTVCLICKVMQTLG